MASSIALSQSMHRITATKLTALSTQRDAFESEKKSLLDDVKNELSQSQRIRLLLDWFLKQEDKVVLDVLFTKNVQRFLNQSRHDNSVSPSLLEEWQVTFEKALDIQSRKYQYASLFGKLVTEWLEHPNDAVSGSVGLTHAESDTASQDSFEQVGRAEMHEQRAEWESIVFNTSTKSDPVTIKDYLSNLFGATSKAKKLSKTPLENLKEHIKDNLRLGNFTPDVVEWCIKGLLRMDLLSRDKRNAIIEFQSNSLVLVELADVLNMELDAIDSWSWGDNPIPLDMRRHLNGKYRVFMDEEILQALFLHFIGTMWAVHLKTVFMEFFHSGAWKQSSFRSLDRKARQRREGFLGSSRGAHSERGAGGRGGRVGLGGGDENSSTVRNERRSKYQRDFLLTQLPSSISEKPRDYGNLSTDEDSEVKSPVAIKQSILHLVTTESLVNTRLYGSFTILQSDFKWFGPSLPHATIFAVLEFFGVPEKWLKFFRKFLEPPIIFAHDGPEAQTQVRRNGVPIQHVLSDALGEAVLFCLDFSVNQATSTNLYRFHDDLWFWGQDELAITAWKAIREFTEVMGLSLNTEKTGSIQIRGKSESAVTAEGLPKGSVQWGFLRLSASGKWVIDDKEVDDHIEELRRQLSACKSVLAWVQAWNTYVSRFFATHFGQPADCLGQQHIDLIIESFARIQRKLFTAGKDIEDSAIGYLKRMVAERFQMTDISHGFFYFPIELGGLDLQNPLIPLLLVHADAYQDPMERIEQAFEREEESYLDARKAYNDGEIGSHTNSRSAYVPAEDEPFMSLEEYTRYLEETSYPLWDAYTDLLGEPRIRKVERMSEVEDALEKLPPKSEAKCEIHGDWHGMTPYYQWVAQLYGGDVLKRFGSLSMGEKRLLPIGLASMLRSDKIRWQG